METFNVIVMYVSDLGHKKELLGRVQCTAKYGCPHCKKSRPDWSSMAGSAAPISMTEMVNIGKKAERKLGVDPDKDSSSYTTFHQSNYGQTVIFIFAILN